MEGITIGGRRMRLVNRFFRKLLFIEMKREPFMKSRSRRARSSLAIVEKGFRGALEEQYGNIVWLSECMRAMGANHNLLLCGSAIPLCFAEQQQQLVKIGDLTITTVSHFKKSILELLKTGCNVWVLGRDLDQFSARNQLIDGILIAESLAALCVEHDDVWFW